MGTRKRAPRATGEHILQRLNAIQASLVRIEGWLARIAAARVIPPAADRPPKLLSREEVCSLLGVTPSALNVRIRRGKFPRPTFGGGRRSVWREEDVFRERR